MADRSPGAVSVESLDLVLTSSCNLSCSYCYQTARSGSTMEWETLRAALDLLLRSEKPERSLSFYGGEPLLALPLIKRAIRYIASARPADREIGFTITTNGLLLDRATVRFLARHGVDTTISCDGVESAQELRSPGSFRRLDRVLRDLGKNEPEYLRDRCQVAMTLNSQNVEYLAESFAYLLDRGVQKVALSALVTHDPGWHSGLIEVLADQMAAVLTISLERLERSGEIPFLPFRPAERNGRPITDSPPVCGAADPKSLTIDADGQVYRCVMLAESYQERPGAPSGRNLDAIRLGDLFAPDLGRRVEAFSKQAHAAEIFDNKAEKYSSYRRCRGCRYLHQCTVCPVASCHIPDNTDPNLVPDIQCALNLVVLACRERFLKDRSHERPTQSSDL